jgi:hypothetical protein
LALFREKDEFDSHPIRWEEDAAADVYYGLADGRFMVS